MNFCKKLGFFISFIFILSCSSSVKTTNRAYSIESYKFESVNYDELKTFFQKDNDTLYLLNFWATWCRPCVEEISYFLELNKNMRNKKFKMILVSLDRPSSFETNLKTFVEKNKIDADVYLLNDITRMNYWITDIDSSWSGALPATLLYKKRKKKFFIEQQLSRNELFKIVNTYLL